MNNFFVSSNRFYNFFNKHLKEEIVHFYLNFIFVGITKVMKSLPIFNPEPKIIKSRKNIMKSVSISQLYQK